MGSGQPHKYFGLESPLRTGIYQVGIGVNAAGVAGVATPLIFDLHGSSCVDDPLIF